MISTVSTLVTPSSNRMLLNSLFISPLILPSHPTISCPDMSYLYIHVCVTNHSFYCPFFFHVTKKVHCLHDVFFVFTLIPVYILLKPHSTNVFMGRII